MDIILIGLLAFGAMVAIAWALGRNMQSAPPPSQAGLATGSSIVAAGRRPGSVDAPVSGA